MEEADVAPNGAKLTGLLCAFLGTSRGWPVAHEVNTPASGSSSLQLHSNSCRNICTEGRATPPPQLLTIKTNPTKSSIQTLSAPQRNVNNNNLLKSIFNFSLHRPATPGSRGPPQLMLNRLVERPLSSPWPISQKPRTSTVVSNFDEPLPHPVRGSAQPSSSQGLLEPIL